MPACGAWRFYARNQKYKQGTNITNKKNQYYTARQSEHEKRIEGEGEHGSREENITKLVE